MFNLASTLAQIKLWRKWALTFIAKFGLNLEKEIWDLFYFVQEMFVKHMFPNYSIDLFNSDEIWNWGVDFRNKNQKDWMQELRKLVCLIYQDLYRKVDKESKIDLLKISFPVMITCINEGYDSITGENPTHDSILSLLQWLLISLDPYDKRVIILFESILFNLFEMVLSIYNKAKSQNK